MMVYRDTARQVLRERLFAEVAASGDGMELLAAFGELESAAMDALWDERDGVDCWTVRFRRAALAAGELFLAQRGGETPVGAVERFAADLDRLAGAPLPARLRVSVPEGYAYYGLYPETYAAAAETFLTKTQAADAVVIGIRSIGTSLSAVVGAALRRRGCAVRAYTVRPRGHPFDRRLAATPRLERQWRERAEGWFLIVDEGPGLSGSSFACVARRLSELGVADERIALFPSWNPNPAQLLSPDARERWPRHRHYVVSFETAVLPRIAGAAQAREFSAGRWRNWLCGAETWPAVQPQHERRKYLLPEDGRPARLMKFEGLGRYGRRRMRRAERLAGAGFCPAPESFADGFLVSRFVGGRTATAADAGPPLLEAMASYLAHLRLNFAHPEEADPGPLREMIQVNLAEGLGCETPAWLRKPPPRAPAVEIDGRMLPHEWIAAGGGYVKTDALDHHDDHFLPGRQDIAWDVAGACVEFDLTAEQSGYLMDRYREKSAGDDVSARLPFYLGSYLAYRLGYCSLAAGALAGEPDGNRLATLASRYARRLRRELEERR